MKEVWGCAVEEEVPVGRPLVSSDGRMDVVVHRHGQKLLIDVVVSTTATDQAAELARRRHEPGRSLRTAAVRKLTRYGPSVLAFAAEDSGRLGSGTIRLLKELAKEQGDDAALEYQRLASELQHVVLSATATMLQVARGQPPTL